MTYAKIIADSISPAGHRLTTMEVRFHRFVLAEFNTHRVFSRNSASSRAIPVEKQIKRLWDEPAWPVKWASEQPGMQGGDVVESPERAESIWGLAQSEAIDHAHYLIREGVHKSIVNRLLEPFMWHTVIVTSTAWENFFNQRVSSLAQPEIREAADMMLEAYDASQPMAVYFGEWHVPYITGEDWEELNARGVPEDEIVEALKKVSVARCARVSYLTHDGQRSLDKDIELYGKLVTAEPPHWSPLEHVAMADIWNVRKEDIPSRDFKGQIVFDSKKPSATVELPKVGNFVGWTQQRFLVEQQQGVNTYA